MANLRTNNLCGEGGRNAYDGSVFFDGAYSYLQLASGEIISGTGFGTGDFTIEFWINQQVNSNSYTGIVTLTSTTNLKRFEVSFHSGTIQVYTDTGAWRDTGYTPVSGVYEHIVFQRDYSGNTLKMYANGVQKWSVSNNRDYDEPFTTKIGIHGTGYNSIRGYLSNVRICIGHLVYSSNNFTPPTTPLTVHYTADDDKTVLLCCQDSDNPLQEATGKTIVGYGRHADSSVELVTNGGPTTDVTGWTAYNSSVSYDVGQIKVTRSGGTGFSAYATLTNLVIGQRYKVSAQIRSENSRCDLYITTAVASGSLLSLTGPTGATADVSGFFTATSGTSYVFTAIDGDGHVGYYNRVSVKAADYGDAPKFLPPYGVDAGNTFDGAIAMNSPSYMCFPTGRTEERGRGRGLNGGSSTPTNITTIDYFQIQSTGNSIVFGDLTTSGQHTSCSSSTRGVFAMGGQSSPGSKQNVIDFVTIATTGNAVDFGDRTVTLNGPGGLSNQTRGIFMGGGNPQPQFDVIDYITIATLGDATDFGNMSSANKNPAGLASPTRGCFAHGGDPFTNTIDYITIATTGNAQDFGDTTESGEGYLACASDVRGIFVGGNTSPANINTIQYITIATTGNATDFGDIGSNRVTAQSGAGTSNNLRGVTMGGFNNPNQFSTTMEYVNIATTSNSFDFGYLTSSRVYTGACSDSHGGLY